MAGPVMSRFLGFRHHGFFPAILRSDSYTSAGCCSLWNPMVDRMMALNVQPPSAIMGSSSMAFAFKMAEFYQPRKSGRMVTVSVVGKQVPLYGAGAGLHSKPNNGRLGAAVVPVELDLVLRARAHILGLLVKSKFYRRVHCRLHIHEAHLGRPARGVAAGCQYHDGLR